MATKGAPLTRFGGGSFQEMGPFFPDFGEGSGYSLESGHSEPPHRRARVRVRVRVRREKRWAGEGWDGEEETLPRINNHRFVEASTWNQGLLHGRSAA